MAQIGWGKNRLFVRDITDSNKGWRELPTPAEDTFEVATEKGDKLEAKIEGGEYEDVMYKKNTATVSFDIRVAKGRLRPFADKMGIIEHEYEFYSQPMDADVPAGIHISRGRVSCEVKGTDADGVTLTYTIEPLTPSDSSVDAMQVGKVSLTESDGKITAITFTELDAVEEPAE